MMKKYAWATDIHLDCLANNLLSAEERERAHQDAIFNFFSRISNEQVDGLFLTGDLSTGVDLFKHLTIMEIAFQKPIYFVLGNHDYWMSSIVDVRKKLADLSNKSSSMQYLGASSFEHLTPTTALIGHDGWYDALNGNYAASNFYLNDWNYTFDFLNASDLKSIVRIARRLASVGVAHVKRGIKLAIDAGYRTIVVLTHFPPFEAVHTYRGRSADANATPWYTSKLMGDMLLEEASKNPSIEFQVYTGHTHNYARVRVASNVLVEVGEAQYGQPALQRIINVA